MRVRWSSTCHVVAKMLKCFKRNLSCHDLSRPNCQVHMRGIGRRNSWTVRNLCVTGGTTCRKLCVTLPSWQISCHGNGKNWHAKLRGIAGTKFVPVRGLLKPGDGQAVHAVQPTCKPRHPRTNFRGCTVVWRSGSSFGWVSSRVLSRISYQGL